jgi:hypothetical protein
MLQFGSTRLLTLLGRFQRRGNMWPFFAKRKRKHLRKRPPFRKPEHTIAKILAWADAYHSRTGSWPTETSGIIRGTLGENWRAVDRALRAGVRGLRGDSSLAQLLAEQRGVRNIHHLPPYTIEQILAWADAYHARTGCWPYYRSGPIPEAPGESWRAVQAALQIGRRGLPGGMTLTRLLGEQRGMRNLQQPPPLSIKQILAWADDHHAQTGEWPSARSGSVPAAPGESWGTINWSMFMGARGLKGKTSLAQLLLERRGVRTHGKAPPLTIRQILSWADAFHTRTGEWPTAASGSIPQAPGETWSAVTKALVLGIRGLAAGQSLARLLVQKRGARKQGNLPRLTIQQVLDWADAYHRREGGWPSVNARSIAEAPEETWQLLNSALTNGHRGLPGSTSLAKLLAKYRGAPNQKDRPRLTPKQILRWADAHFQRTGAWPHAKSGPIPNSNGDTWGGVNTALRHGIRGLAGGSSLYRLLVRYRGNAPRIDRQHKSGSQKKR